MSDEKEIRRGTDELGNRIRTMLRLRRPQDVAAYVSSLPDEGTPWSKWYLSLTVMASAAKTRHDATCWRYILEEFCPAMPPRCATDVSAAERKMMQRIEAAEDVARDGVAALTEKPREPLCPRARAALDDRIQIMRQMGCELELSLACEGVLLRHDDDQHIAELKRFLVQAFEDIFRRGDGGVRRCRSSIMLGDLRRIARRAGLTCPPWV